MKASKGSRLMKPNAFIIGLALVIALASMSMFTVHITQSAVLLELQKPKEIITKPGLYFKTPFIQKVRYFSKQLLDNDSPPAEVKIGRASCRERV